MKFLKLFLIPFLFPALLNAQGIITTMAGNGQDGYTGDGGPATSALLFRPYHGCFDKQGNYYFIPVAGNSVRKIAPDGIITTIAGNNGDAHSGDGGPAILAQLNYLNDIACDAAGNVYVLSSNPAGRIRKIDVTTGIITLFAGSETASTDGEGGPAIDARLNYPFSMCFNKNDELYVTCGKLIRKISTNGIITTICSSGALVVGGPNVDSLGKLVFAICADTFGNVFFAGQEYIRKIRTDGTVETAVGNGSGTFNGDWLPGTQTSVYPLDIAVDGVGNLYFADHYSSRLRVLETNGLVHTISGSDSGYSGDNGPPIDAKLRMPSGVDLDSCDNIVIIDWSVIRTITYSYCHALNAPADLVRSKLSVYPNPASTELHITLGEKISSFSIVDVMGRVIAQRSVDSDQIIVDVRDFPYGVYFVRAGNKMLKFVRE